jgi:hypothetical protein
MCEFSNSSLFVLGKWLDLQTSYLSGNTYALQEIPE